MSQSTVPDDEGAVAAAAAQQMAELLETCAALKRSINAAEGRIVALEQQNADMSRELTAVKLKLQLPDQSETSVSGQVRAADAESSEAVTTAAPPVAGDDAPVTAACASAQERIASSERRNEIVPPAAANRARHSSGSSDIVITGYHAPVRGTSPAVGFTFPAKDRRRLVRSRREPRITRSATSGSSPIVTQNRFAVLSDESPTEVNLHLHVVQTTAYLHKVYMGRFDPETSEAHFRAYLRRRVVKNELDIDDVMKLSPQSRSNVDSCSFCVTVSSTAARKELFAKSAWPLTTPRNLENTDSFKFCLSPYNYCKQ